MKKFLLFCSLLLTGSVWGQRSLQPFLAPLQEHPGLQAVRATLAAAELQARGAYEPIAVTANSGFSLLSVDEVDLDPETDGVQGIPTSGGQFSIDTSFRPFPFGDIADLVDQRQLELVGVQLDYRETLTGLETQALQAAANLQLAQEVLVLAEKSDTLANDALEATRLRFEKGAANARELRDAEEGAVDTARTLENARANLALARQSLISLVGDVAAPALPDLVLPLPTGTPLSLSRAELQVKLARVGTRNSERGLYPTLQAGYTWNLDERNSLGVSLESRTLQPKVTYTYQAPGRLSLPDSAVNGTFTVGVGLSIGEGTLAASEAAKQQEEAAKAGLTAAQNAATLERTSLETTLAQAEREAALAQVKFDNARATLDEAQRREELGLSIPLETQEAAIEVNKTALELRQARQNVLAATLTFYTFYAQPVSEVTP